MIRGVLLVALAAFLASAEAGACAASDVSIVQEGMYTDMTSQWVQTRNKLEEAKMAVFTAQFSLKCKGDKPISAAALTAKVVYRSGSEAYKAKPGITDVAVLASKSGSYQVSFALPEDETPAGEYKAEIFFAGEKAPVASMSCAILRAEIFFAGEKAPVASISLFHSVPLISGRHMEMLGLFALTAPLYYVSNQFAVSA